MFAKLDSFLQHAETAFAALGLLGATFLMFLNVVLRYAFNAGLPWSEELIRYTIIWLTFLSIGLCTRQNAHVAIDFFAYFLPKRAQRYLLILVDATLVAFTALMLRYSLVLVGQQLSTGQRSPALQIPFYLIYFCLPFGFALGLLRSGQNLVRHCRGR
ncbi:MAG TPA: TRAP transporter small permease [Firmicutes bacterium]|nr:TRAP transporter small permease [Bacillota bacterium]